MHVLPIFNLKFSNLFKFKFCNIKQKLLFHWKRKAFWQADKNWSREGISISKGHPIPQMYPLNDKFPSLCLEYVKQFRNNSFS